MRYHALIPAAGNGFRFGGPLPKQYAPLDGRPVLHHVISRLASSIPLHSINIVVSEQDEWVDHVNEVAKGTMYTAATCNSWYLGANIPGKPRVFLPYVGGLPAYIERADAVADAGYEGFTLA